MKVRSDVLVRGTGELVTMSSPRGLGVVKGGALAARDGRIVWVGPEADLAANVELTEDALVIDAEGACVLPGFVDAHTHLVFGGERSGEYAARLGGAGYLEIQAADGGIMATVRAPAPRRWSNCRRSSTGVLTLSSGTARPRSRPRPATDSRSKMSPACFAPPRRRILRGACTRCSPRIRRRRSTGGATTTT
jgi:imidazolonepropionase-like amidohydrolase